MRRAGRANTHNWGERGRSRSGYSTHARSSAAKTMLPSIWVIDDQPDNLVYFELALSEHYRVRSFTCGVEALEKIETTPPDLILLDLMMPGIDGFEVTSRVRALENLPYIPILIITASQDCDPVQALCLGADDLLRKPVNLEELRARVQSLLRLKLATDRQNQVLRQKQDLMSRLAHDLRTPLTAADQMLCLIEAGEMEPSQIVLAIATLRRSHQNLLEMVNNLLEVDRYDLEQKKFRFRTLDVGSVVKNVVEELLPLARAKELTLELKPIPPDLPCVRGDRLEIRRVVQNLLGNAIKFTDFGGVTVRCAVEEVRTLHETALGSVVVEVSDTGCGIPTEELESIFERYRRAHHTRKVGSGLGLYLVNRICTAHHGTIEVDSEFGKGSTFAVKFPASLQ